MPGASFHMPGVPGGSAAAAGPADPSGEQSAPIRAQQAFPADYESRSGDRLPVPGPVETRYRRERGGPRLYAELFRFRWATYLHCPQLPRFHTWGSAAPVGSRARSRTFKIRPSVRVLRCSPLKSWTIWTAPPGTGRWTISGRAHGLTWQTPAGSGRIFGGLRRHSSSLSRSSGWGPGIHGEGSCPRPEGVAFTKQRRFSDAVGLLRRAVIIFLEVGETHRAGRALVRTSSAHSLAGEPEKAISLLYRALDLIDPAASRACC